MELTLDEALKRGVEAHQSDQIQEAERLYTSILQAQPKHPDANHNMGVLAVGVGKIQEALPFFKVAIEANSSIAQFWLSYIGALIKLDHSAEAQSVFYEAKGKGFKGESFDQLAQQLQVNESNETVLEVDDSISSRPSSLILNTTAIDKALRLAKRRSKEGHLDEAKEIYGKILQSRPKNKKALAALQLLTGGVAEVQIDPPSEQLQPLINLYLQGQLQRALSDANKMLEHFPHSDILYNIAGSANLGLMKFEAAIYNFKQLLKLKPDFAEAYNNMGTAFNSKGDSGAAIECYKMALKIKPDYAEAHNNMGVTFKTKSDLKSAITSYRQALKIKPSYAEAHNNMGIALSDNGELEAALNSYKQALKIKPDYAEAYNNMGTSLADSGDLEACIGSYKQALKIQPHYATAYYNLGLALKEKGDLGSAIENYKQALKIKPNYPEIYNDMGLALKDYGDSEAAIESYKQAIKIKPDYADAYNNMGTILSDNGKPDAAIESYKQALNIDPNNCVFHVNISMALGDIGEKQASIDSCKVALKINPDDTRAFRHLSSLGYHKEHNEYVVKMQSLYLDLSITDEQRCNLSFALSKVFEDQNEIRQSLNYLETGNKLQKKILSYDIEIDREVFNQVKISHSDITKFALQPAKKITEVKPIFILGMPRSGTTLVEQIISSHSKVLGAGELLYAGKFGQSIATGVIESNSRIIMDFRHRYIEALEKKCDGQAFVTDKMPNNFLYVGLIFSAFPNAKIIHVNRDPAATCWSNYKHFFGGKGLGYSYNLEDTVAYFGLYQDLMQFWYRHYQDRIYHLNYDRLTENQEDGTRKLIHYLGLEWEGECLSPQSNSRSVRTVSQMQVRQKIYQGSSQQWRKFEPFLNGIFDQLATL